MIISQIKSKSGLFYLLRYKPAFLRLMSECTKRKKKKRSSLDSFKNHKEEIVLRPNVNDRSMNYSGFVWYKRLIFVNILGSLGSVSNETLFILDIFFHLP